MKYATFVTAILIALFSSAQEQLEFYKVPKDVQKNTDDLTHYLIKEASTDSAKAAQIYQWITHNIDYDYAIIESGKELEYMSATQVLEERKTVCQGYTALMVEMLKVAGIPAAGVEGYTSDHLSDSLLYLVESDHEWVMFQANSKWYMCDPTWDAGYIGRVPKYKKDIVKADKIAQKRKAKLEKAAKEKKKKRLEHRFKKQDQQEAKKEERLDGEYASKVGFVRNPNRDYFMLASDTFVQTHLASIPELQLREYPIAMEDFTMKTKLWDTILERKKGTPVDYASYANAYANKPLNKQWMERANKGFAFNDLSYLGKMLHYYNFIGLHLNENFRKEVEVVSKADLDAEMHELRAMNDSVLTYIKPAKEISKDAFAESKKELSKGAKDFKATDKAANALIGKVITAQENNMEVLKKSGDRIEKDVEFLNDRKAKLIQEYREIPQGIELDEKLVPEQFEGWIDSLFTVLEEIDSLRTHWNGLVNSEEVVDERFSNLEDAWRTSYFNLYILNSYTSYYDDTVAHYDTLIANSLTALLDYHKQTFTELMYPQDVLKAYRNFERISKNGISRLKVYETKHPSYQLKDMRMYLASLNNDLIGAITDDYYAFSSVSATLLNQEKQYTEYYEDVRDNLKEEKEVKVDNIEYTTELMEKERERTMKVIENIQEGSQKLDEFFDERLGK